MALHPDNPPVPVLQGVGRVLINADAIRKALSIFASPFHGLTFCQGTYLTMGKNIPALLIEFGKQGKMHFVHLRDEEGKPDHFHEIFHDNGPTNIPEMLKLYPQIGSNDPLRSDHILTMAGEVNEHDGCGMSGNPFGIGSIKGMMDAIKIEST